MPDSFTYLTICEMNTAVNINFRLQITNYFINYIYMHVNYTMEPKRKVCTIK